MVRILSAEEVEKLKGQSRRHKQAAAGVFIRAITLREALYQIALSLLDKSRIAQKDLKIVNTEFQMAQDHRLLVESDGKIFLAWKNAPLKLDKMLWAITQSAADYLACGAYRNLRECVNFECGWLFEDTSRNRRRSWCDMQDCGNLDKVRRFRARARQNQLAIG